jgi:DNA-binding HxlR family transcriptional regulator
MEEVLIKDLLKDNNKISTLVDDGLSEVLKELENDGIIISPFCYKKWKYK